MQGEYKKLLLHEFGQSRYRYFVTQAANIQSTDEILSVPVIRIMIRTLLDKSDSELKQMETRLNEALLISYRICQGFIPYLVCSILSIIFIKFITANTEVTIISIIGILLCLTTRMVQYSINKFCYVDARLILSYKVSLDMVKKITGRNERNT